ncbi:hypothetical protein BBO99_00008313 [Phytophthora kernoviae]|uniref:Uncharacterized protein n=2 Tax=Phytophthora kernoviae TaxID=325452 RepID=A0A3R7K4U3_9STRA|nr:hypothetical protein G195_009398 [Phytophthora kernoviae 00238/432]KAG2512871.1 hypothetical protein JM16_008039 [Phytophthora kernoviae]KAG2516563.1 hypothetical protein JM18_007998 [Phytophthora kernoviae]RLN15054.1 hypothetical protein BBI17_008268 [Phytophthora kernoviae]RLN75485.1 hypothetical protein BBO99_00008313 [Phytophthora kernoviae]
MLDTNSSGLGPLRHDAETFRVAEELIMLSNHAVTAPPTSLPLEQKPTLVTDSPSNISGFFEHTPNANALSKAKVQTRAQQRSHRTSAQILTQQDIINSRCDISHSELLKEHRVRFRRVRQRCNLEQRTKNREYLARFHVQGIPLVQHLEALTHWR